MKYFPFISFAINLIPKSFLRPLASIIAKFLVFFLKRDSKVAAAQIEFVLGTSSFKPILEASYQNSILSVFEVFRFRKIFNAKPSLVKPKMSKTEMGDVTLVDPDVINTVLTSDKAAVYLGGHFSNFDLMTAYFSYQGAKMSVLARAANNQTIQDIVQQIRLDYGVKVLLRDNPGSATALLRAIKKNEIICALIDQDIDIESEYVKFFGLEARYPVGLLKVAVKFKLPVLFVYCVRNKDNSFKIGMSKIDWEGSNDPDPVNYILRTYTALLEELIKTNPDQWVWWHRRWRRRPGVDYQKHPEKLMSTQQYVEWLKSLEKTRK